MQPITNFGLRLATQVGRFLLVLLLAKALSAEQLGTFNLLTIATDYGRQILGLAFFQYSIRAIQKPDANKADLFRDNATYILLASVIVLPASLLFVPRLLAGELLTAFFILVFIDTFNQMVENFLIGDRKSSLSNLLLFTRTALWVYLLTVILFQFPDVITLQLAVYAWVAASIGTLILGFIVSWRSGYIKFTKLLPNWERIVAGAKTGATYCATGFLLLLVFTSARLALARYGSDTDIGVLFFYYAVFSTTGSLVYASIVAIKLPSLISAAAEKKRDEFISLYKQIALRSFALTTVLSLCVVPLLQPVVQWVGDEALIAAPNLVIVAAAIAGVMVALYQIPYNAIYALGRDKILLAGIASAALISVASAFVLTPSFGLEGAAISMTISALALGLIMVTAARFSYKKHPWEVAAQQPIDS